MGAHSWGGLGLILPLTVRGEDVTAWILGRSIWWEVGDIIQMDGDCATSTALDPCHECDAWQYDDCEELDKCFRFREVSGEDIEDCTYDQAQTVYGSIAFDCFWLGEVFTELCEEEPYCPKNNYCESLWEILEYNSAPGDVEVGCYKLKLLCTVDEPSCTNAAEDKHVCGW